MNNPSRYLQCALITLVLVPILALTACNGEHTGHEHGHGSGHGEDAGRDADRKPSGALIDGVRVVEIEARRYEFVPDPVFVNLGETVRLEITSTDVEHGIAIADFDIEEDLPAGETVTVEFEADAPGSHHMHCSVFCGPGHERMHGQLLVLAAEDD